MPKKGRKTLEVSVKKQKSRKKRAAIWFEKVKGKVTMKWILMQVTVPAIMTQLANIFVRRRVKSFGSET